MVVGRVNAQLEPTIPIDVIDSTGASFSLTAIIDTGFDGELLLPRHLLNSLSWPYRGRRTAVLGDGTKTTFDVFRGTMLWQQTERPVVVLESAGDIIVGMRLLSGWQLIFPLVPKLLLGNALPRSSASRAAIEPEVIPRARTFL
jgi:clan AA aspartic protease